MQITKKIEGNAAMLDLSGRLDTMTAPLLETEINELDNTMESLTLNLSGVEYVSSAGLRVLLFGHKKMAGSGGMFVTGIHEDVMEVLEMTGFSNILNLK